MQYQINKIKILSNIEVEIFIQKNEYQYYTT
jgi:hypothetical protein